jgi:hypothetical protein
VFFGRAAKFRLLAAVSGSSRMPFAVYQGRQRRDASAARKEQLGRCAAGRSKYYRLYLYSGKERSPRRDVAGRGLAAGAPQLAHILTAVTHSAPAAQKLGVGLRRPLPRRGGGVVRHALGDGAHCPCADRPAALRLNATFSRVALALRHANRLLARCSTTAPLPLPPLLTKRRYLHRKLHMKPIILSIFCQFVFFLSQHFLRATEPASSKARSTKRQIAVARAI